MVLRGKFIGEKYSYALDNGQSSTLKKGKVYEIHTISTSYCNVVVSDRNSYVHTPIELLEIIPSAQEAPPEVKRPDSEHYHTGGIDVWKFAKANFSYEALFGFHQINIIKYLTRFGKKNGRNIKDLEKAKAIIEELIKMEKERAESD